MMRTKNYSDTEKSSQYSYLSSILSQGCKNDLPNPKNAIIMTFLTKSTEKLRVSLMHSSGSCTILISIYLNRVVSHNLGYNYGDFYTGKRTIETN
jgi:hypothetical protein